MPETIGKRKSETQVEQELKKVKAFLMAVIPESWDKYDFRAKYDSSLTYLENKNAIIEDIRALSDFKGSTMKEQADYAKAQQEKMLTEETERIADEVEKYNKEVSMVLTKELDAFYAPVDRVIDKLCKGFSHLVFIKGRGGIGKSRRIRHILTKNQEQFFEVTGDVTEAYLYRLFYENNGKTLWFKDVTRILRGLNSINLIKSACETEKQRLLTKCSYSRQQDDLPDMFIFKGKLIFDYNEIGPLQLKEDFEALVSRGDFIELAFSNEDIACIMRAIAQSDWQKEVTEYLMKSFDGLLNLRHQWKAFQTYEYATKIGKDWHDLVTSEITADFSEVKAILYTLIGNKAVRVADLKRVLLRNKRVNSLRTATNRIRDWLAMDELYRWSIEKHNFYVSIRPVPDGIAKIPKEVEVEELDI
jgi:hypothetical protein